MNEEICCITNKEKLVKNEWKMLSLYTVYIKNWDNSYNPFNKVIKFYKKEKTHCTASHV